MTPIYWLIVFVVLIAIEIATLALTTIWFAGGAFIGFLLSLLGFSTGIQLVGFVLISFLLLFLTRPFAKHCITHTEKTNVDSLVGHEARVTAEIDNRKETGTAMVNGQEWTARAESDEVIYPVGTIVEIRKIQGVKLIVSAKKEG
ncbi:NfeD family protein [Brotaphodocola sp.]|uniref:NfeD family protein n=1 Tax=Brotaphodocola sp. TaxID=3073577 RepID=UPI003D7D45BF